jgi:SAM-dependent methyltransferase
LRESELRALDSLLAPSDRWNSFYSDRARPCPFFVSAPCESLSAWIDEGLVRPGRAIDLGCGHGRNSIFLAHHGFAVEAIDYSQTAVDWAEEAVRTAGVSVSLRRVDVFESDLASSSYELVYDSGCFHHIAPHRREQYVDLVVRALKPGGWFGLTCFRPEGGSGYTDDEVYARRSLGGGLGYTEDDLREIWGHRLSIRQLRQMKEQGDASGLFGKDFLWVLLAQKV